MGGVSCAKKDEVSMIVFISFLLLASLTFSMQESRSSANRRNLADWALDGTGLVIQGVVVPALQSVLIFGLLLGIAPKARGILSLSAVPGFMLNFVMVDYLYYWNHRWLHFRSLWPAHAVHHTPDQMDVFITSRNTLWTPLLIVYLWVNGLFIFLLRDPGAFILGASLTASLDLWRHSSFSPRPGSAFHRALGLVLITPHEHAWHHSRDRADCNFGANLSLWDRLHGTYHSPTVCAEAFGVPSTLSLKRKLFFPFGA
jgi:sterol desaturase/sphingolipid hydroxylase (fatty acid hydroxylase superfamily)